MQSAETPKKLEAQESQPKKSLDKIPPRGPRDVMIGRSPFAPKQAGSPETVLKTDFTTTNPLGAKIGDKIKIFVDEKPDENWEILDINPKTGEIQLHKNGQFEKARVTDPNLVMLNKTGLKQPKQKPAAPKPIPQEKKVLVNFPGVQSMETQISAEAVPFTIGQKVKVKRTLGKIEDDWTFRKYNEETGRALVSKGNKYKNPKLRKLMEWNK